MASVLAVGMATLDVIDTVARYPAEDAEVRAQGRRVARGGNAANTLEVLARLGHRAEWLGTLADDPDAERIVAGLEGAGIGARHAPRIAGGCSPVSHITLSRETGSRTIVHHRDLPELTAADFAHVPLDGLDWLHLEGRNIAEVCAMLRDARARAPQLPISVELEKPRDGAEDLAAAADVVLCGQAFAGARGFDDPERYLAVGAPGSGSVFCAWGEAGAWLRDPGGAVEHEPAHPPERVVDTVGAGDAFNAGVIHALVQGLPPRVALSRATRLAGAKCGRDGFAGLEALA